MEEERVSANLLKNFPFSDQFVEGEERVRQRKRHTRRFFLRKKGVCLLASEERKVQGKAQRRIKL